MRRKHRCARSAATVAPRRVGSTGSATYAAASPRSTTVWFSVSARVAALDSFEARAARRRMPTRAFSRLPFLSRTWRVACRDGGHPRRCRCSALRAGRNRQNTARDKREHNKTGPFTQGTQRA
jgi:hypothetical protein